MQLQLIQVCDRTSATSAKTANITKNYKNPKWPKKFKSGLGTVQKFKAVQKIQLRPKYEQIQKWPKKFKSGLSTVQKFKWSKKFNKRPNYEEKSKSTLSNTRNWISQCSIKRDNTLQMLPRMHS